MALTPNGEGGIRTHAPLRTNGFQDRLVMTTSIPLHVSHRFLSDKRYSSIFSLCRQFPIYIFSGCFSISFYISENPGILFLFISGITYDALHFFTCSSHKNSPDFQIFRCRQFDVFIAAHYQFNRMSHHRLHDHGIICHLKRELS